MKTQNWNNRHGLHPIGLVYGSRYIQYDEKKEEDDSDMDQRRDDRNPKVLALNEEVEEGSST